MMIKQILSLSILVFYLLSVPSCTVVRQGVAMIKTPGDFTLVSNNVKIEDRSDEQFAMEVSECLPHLMGSVEAKHFHKSIKSPTIYICNTNMSFCKYTGTKYPGPRGFTNPKGIFVSPRLKGSPDLRAIVYHELSHFIMLQYVGIYHYRTIPVWFHEGLATFISNGGGSGDVTDSAATLEILKGNHFTLVDDENVLFPKSVSSDKLRVWLYYRQSMLFVEFLREEKPKAFENLLISVFKKKQFSDAVEESYGAKLSVLWDVFLEELKKKEEQRSSPDKKNTPGADSKAPRRQGATAIRDS